MMIGPYKLLPNRLLSFWHLLSFEQADNDLILDGELYADKTVADFNTIISCVRKTKPTTGDLETSKQ